MNRKLKRRNKGPLAREAQVTGWLFISPMLLGFTLLLLFPMGKALYMSLNDWPLLGEHRFVGLDNYKDIAVDPLFWKVFGNTAYFTLGLVPFNIVLALMLALLLSRSLKGIGIFRTAIFVPVMTSLIVWSIVWKYMFATDSGLINQLLMLFNIKGAAWLYDERLAMPAVIVTSVLKNVGLNMVLFIAAIQQVSRSLYEAAELDGAGKTKTFFNVTLPMITPTVFLTVVMTVIGSLKVFGQIYVMTQGGPSNSTKVLVYYIWEKAFKLFQMGYASALAFVLFFVVLILTLLQWQLRKRWVFNESDA
ncbi:MULTISPECIES: sugar ABC transporter permease [unclassified Paenibacillus]|uniref:carbohydrate ABC transporter permease n=1 Tax=unclassified Paenibacillus TaxID=185978 RepID=UPI0003E22360|nr:MULTISPECIES: sugar ABC transporter permease [unclassified Paenibacillus]ETT48305.1 binding-protein-dependent transport systems inner membrane component [Paenibacillus sp. FSL R7-269]OMF93582.1 sugar ABC transporter permease [Paenibacillus sp. FSL R7-0337]